MWLPSFGVHVASELIQQESELCMPSLQMLAHFFDTAAGNVLIIPAVWPRMEPWSIEDVFWCVQDNIDELRWSVQWMLIGGALQCDNYSIAENVVSKFSSPIDFSITGKQTAFLFSPTNKNTGKQTDSNVFSSSIHTDGPWSWFCKLPAEEKTEEKTIDSRAVQPQKAKSTTPKWDAVLSNIKGHAPEFLDYIANECFFGTLLRKGFRGQELQEPLSLSLKMETLLNTCCQRREMYVATLRERNDIRCDRSEPDNDYNMIFTDKDMSFIMNIWRWDVNSYMQEANRKEFFRHKKNDDHDNANRITKSVFSNHLFHISGNKFLVHCFLRFPMTVRCAEQPVITSLCREYEEHKKSAVYRKAVQQSEKVEHNQLRLCQQIWWAEHNLNQGRHLSFQVRAGLVSFFNLAEWQQNLAQDYEKGVLGDISRKLHHERETGREYAGAGASICARLSATVGAPMC